MAWHLNLYIDYIILCNIKIVVFTFSLNKKVNVVHDFDVILYMDNIFFFLKLSTALCEQANYYTNISLRLDLQLERHTMHLCTGDQL